MAKKGAGAPPEDGDGEREAKTGGISISGKEENQQSDLFVEMKKQIGRESFFTWVKYFLAFRHARVEDGGRKGRQDD